MSTFLSTFLSTFFRKDVANELVVKWDSITAFESSTVADSDDS